MHTIKISLFAMAIILLMCLTAFAQQGDSQEKSTKIALTIEGSTYSAVLYDNAAAKDLIAKLPLTVSLNRGNRDYCGDISPLQYSREQVQKGYRNGELAYWIPGQDFVIFIEKEETGASVDGVVVLGAMTSDIQPLFSLGRSIQVRIAPAEQ
ncbi:MULTISPECIES: cyclophilin-like fold protein [unclassified Desulfovibrio]|uniref:cyclophilin-like fold protein n=1 Tax=unclassified Desulfovibrio TaxID=2593640 RepID=UPI002FD91182